MGRAEPYTFFPLNDGRKNNIGTKPSMILFADHRGAVCEKIMGFII